jgi:hypothetical protein
VSTRRRSIDDVIEFVGEVPGLLHHERLRRRLSLRNAGVEIGISPSHILGIEAGNNYNVGSLKKILEWLNGNHVVEQSGGNGVPDDPTLDALPFGGPDHRAAGGVEGSLGVSQPDPDRGAGDSGSGD